MALTGMETGPNPQLKLGGPLPGTDSIGHWGGEARASTPLLQMGGTMSRKTANKILTKLY